MKALWAWLRVQPWAWIVYAVLAFLLIALVWAAVYVVLIRPAHAEHEAVVAKTDTAFAKAATDSAKDAQTVVSGNIKSEAAIDIRVRGSRDAILSAPGAAAPIDPALADAGLRALCMSDAHARNPDCERLLGAHP